MVGALMPTAAKVVHDRFSYRWCKIPFNVPLAVLAYDFKKVILIDPTAGKNHVVLLKDVKFVKY